MGDASRIEELERENSLLKGDNEALKADKQCGRRWSFATLFCAGIVLGGVCQISWVFAPAGPWAVFAQLIQNFLLAPFNRPAVA